MAVVEAYVGGKKIDPCNNKSELSPTLFSLLLEGIALNTNARVHVLEVCVFLVNNSAKAKIAKQCI